MGPQAQITTARSTAAAQTLGAFDLELLQQLAGVQQLEVRVGGTERLGNGLVFLRQDAASGIHQALSLIHI